MIHDHTLSEKLLAFILFTEKGIEKVKSVYPEHVVFVESLKNKSYKEVKDMLIAEYGTERTSE